MFWGLGRRESIIVLRLVTPKPGRNSGVVIFVDEVEIVNMAITNGVVVVKDTFVVARPLTTPARKVLLSSPLS